MHSSAAFCLWRSIRVRISKTHAPEDSTFSADLGIHWTALHGKVAALFARRLRPRRVGFLPVSVNWHFCRDCNYESEPPPSRNEGTSVGVYSVFQLVILPFRCLAMP